MIDKLIKLSPVPVEFTDTIEIGYAGTFWHKKYDCERPPLPNHIPYIEIKDDLETSEKISALIHEISHAKCHEKNCDCVESPDYTKREIHAFKFQLKWLLKHKQKESLKDAMAVIKEGLNRHDHYLKAAKHIMKLKLWKKCVEFIK